jgi:hypothetical protein
MTHKHSQAKGRPLARASVRSVPCPECGAEANQHCIGSRGQKRWASHQARWDAYRERNIMSNVAIKPVYLLGLDPVEFRLVLRALGGRMTTDTEREEAKQLGDKLFAQRKAEVSTFAKQLGANGDDSDPQGEANGNR